MTILTIIGVIVSAVLMIVLLGCFIFTIKYIIWFHCKTCDKCFHRMRYKGLREDDDGGHYLFHCTHCGAWKNIPKEEFFRELDDEEKD